MICTSISNTPASLARDLVLACEMAELRLDLCSWTTDEAAALCSLPLPLIATCRQAAAGKERTREMLLSAIRCGASYVDLEHDMDPELVNCITDEALVRGCRIIRSYHDFSGTPSLQTLEDTALELSTPGGYVKIVTTAACPDDASVVLALYSSRRLAGLRGRLIAFAMGACGQESRLEAIRLGSPWTYACAGEATVPGQMTAGQTADRLYGSRQPQVPHTDSIPRMRMPVSKSNIQRHIIASALAGCRYVPDSRDLCDDSRAAMKAAETIIEATRQYNEQQDTKKR